MFWCFRFVCVSNGVGWVVLWFDVDPGCGLFWEGGLPEELGCSGSSQTEPKKKQKDRESRTEQKS